MRVSQDIFSQNKPLVSNSIIIALFGGLLSEFSIEEVREFWQELPLEINGVKLNEQEMYEHFWNAAKWIPLEYMYRVLNAIERFCLNKGRNYLEFIHQKCAHLICEPKHYLKMLCILLNVLQQEKDTNIAVLKLFNIMSKILFPGSTLDLLEIKRETSGFHTDLLFVPDKKFPLNSKPPEGYSSIRPFLQKAPHYFGIPEYDMVTVEAEIQDATERVDPHFYPEIRNGLFFIAGEVFGSTLGFYDYLCKKQITLSHNHLPDKRVVLINKDYLCPRRNRTILFKGSAYGAPAYLISVHHQRTDTINPVRMILRNILDQHHFLWKTVEQNYLALLKSLEPKLKVVFKQNKCGIHFNNQFITSGIQAMILREILLLYVNSGITEFERRHFTAIPELISTVYDTGFNTRLNRISSILDNVSAGIRILKSGRGKFCLDTSVKIDYKEVQA